MHCMAIPEGLSIGEQQAAMGAAAYDSPAADRYDATLNVELLSATVEEAAVKGETGTGGS